MFVTGSTGILVVFDSSEPGSTGNLASEVAVHLVPGCLGYLSEIVFDGHHPNPPLYFYKWGNLVPIHIFLPLVLWWYWGVASSCSCCSTFIGVEVDAGGIGQSFFNSNKFPDIFPALGHRVPA